MLVVFPILHFCPLPQNLLIPAKPRDTRKITSAFIYSCSSDVQKSLENIDQFHSHTKTSPMLSINIFFQCWHSLTSVSHPGSRECEMALQLKNRSWNAWNLFHDYRTIYSQNTVVVAENIAVNSVEPLSSWSWHCGREVGIGLGGL